MSDSDIKISYVILVHKNPIQLKKLVLSLQSENSFFVIHVDKKVGIKQFEQELANISKVFFAPQIESKWGNVLGAVLSAFKFAIERIDPDYLYLLSGQDYPIKTTREIIDYLGKNRDKTFMSFTALPISSWKGGGTHRFKRYHLFVSRNRYLRRIENIMNFFLPRRKIPLNYKAYGGELWFGCPRSVAEYLVNFSNNNVVFLNFFKHVYLADELFFQTVLLNSNDDIKGNIINKNLTYVDWSKPYGPYPATFTVHDLESLKKTPELFARKFDLNIDSAIFQKIDTELRK